MNTYRISIGLDLQKSSKEFVDQLVTLLFDLSPGCGVKVSRATIVMTKVRHPDSMMGELGHFAGFDTGDFRWVNISVE